MSRVLIVTNEQDLAADLVVLELRRRKVEVLRCNTERLGTWQVVCKPGRWWQVTDRLGRSLRSEGVSGVWWRRPEPPSTTLRFASTDEEAAFLGQWQGLLESLASVPGPRWISSPAAIRAAEDKAQQLATAARVGFNVPATVWANQAHVGIPRPRTVIKPVTTAAWTDDRGPAFVFAELADTEDLPGPEELAVMPVAFQTPIWPKVDVRATVIGEHVLAAVLNDAGGPAESLDWRLDPDRRWKAFHLDDAVGDCCRTLVAELGLRFGGIDLAVDEVGTAWFLEINPNGEWGWLAHQAGLPIVDRLCDELTAQPHEAA